MSRKRSLRYRSNFTAVAAETLEIKSLLSAVNGFIQAEGDQSARLQDEIDVQKEDNTAVFERLDVTDDNVLTAAEMSEAGWRRIERADSNLNRAVSRTELQQFRARNERDVRGTEPSASFDRVDLNSDGSLTEDEVSQAAWVQFHHADLDGNDAVTLSELESAREKNERELQQPSPHTAFARLDVDNNGQLTEQEISEAVWSRVVRADSNNNGLVSLPELILYRTASERDVQRADHDRAFDRLDANEDGRLTAEEVSSTVWMRMAENADTNGDGAVTRHELWQARRLDEAGVLKPDPGDLFARLDTNGNGKIERAEVSEEGWDRLSHADDDADGGVTPAELRIAREGDEAAVAGPHPADPFARLDVNFDGEITPDEVSAAIWNIRLRPADTDSSGSVTLDEIQASSFNRFDANRDGFITSDEVEPGVWIRMRRSDANNDQMISPAEKSAGREIQEREVRKPNPAAAFAELDENNDGRISADEVSERLWLLISKADANDDGGVTSEELEASREGREAEVETERPHDSFRLLDANDDGRLTGDEVSPTVWSRISRADANDDDAVTLAELQQHRIRTEENATKPGGTVDFETLDINEDNLLTEDEVSERAWNHLQQADTNDDGAVSLSEVESRRADAESEIRSHRPSRRAFARLDANRDGGITQDEVSSSLWARISDADTDSNGSVTRSELQQRRRVHEARATLPESNISFDELDADDDERLTADEVSERIWNRISAADQNNDRGVEKSELQSFRAAAEEAVNRPAPRDHFARLDANSDRSLTEEEVSPQLWAKISRADANGDEAVTLLELFQRRVDREQQTRRPSPADVFAELDANSDGRLTADEASVAGWARISEADLNNDAAVTLEELRLFRELNEGEVQRPGPEAAFDQVDVNQDGQLTEDEVTSQVWDRLSAADADGDDAVTKFELRVRRELNEADARRPDPSAAFQQLDLDENGELTEDEVTALTWAELVDVDFDSDSGVSIGELLLERDENEDKVRRPRPDSFFARLDVNNDGALTEDELRAVAWAAISVADANNDGGVTRQELRDYRAESEDRVRRPGPAAAFGRLDLNDDGNLTADEVSEDIWAKLLPADINEDQNITTDELQGYRDQNEDHVRRPSPASAFERLDVNGDQLLSADEVTASIWTHLAAADSNDDGHVSEAELEAHRDSVEQDARKPTPEAAFQRLDLNGDGGLNEEEVTAEVWEKISRADGDENGVVTLSELLSRRERNEKRSERPEPDAVFDELDVNADAMLTSDEVRAGTFEKLLRADADNDGAITKAELRAAHNDPKRQISWTESDSAQSYEVWINHAATNSLALREDGLSSTALSLMNLDDGDYFVWIQDEDAEGRGRWRSRQQVTVQGGELAVGQSAGELTWQAFGNATTYEVWISLNGQRVGGAAGVGSTSYTLPGLADATYSYWIQAEDANGNGQWSSRMTFEVSDGELVVVQGPGTLSWDPDASAASYEVWINAAGTKQRVAGAKGLASAEFDVPFLEDGAYDYWIQYENAQGGGEWSGKRTFLIRDGVLTDAPPVGTITWQLDAAAVSYEVWISDGGNGQRVLRESGITSNRFEMPYVADGTYYYWIQNEDSTGRGSWSRRQTFVVVNGEIRTTAGTVSWQGDSSAVTYEIWVSDAGGTSRPVFRRGGIETTSIQLPPLQDGAYDYWIQSEDESGAGVWSALLNFTVLNGVIV